MTGKKKDFLIVSLFLYLNFVYVQNLPAHQYVSIILLEAVF